MKLIKQFAIIMFITFIGETLSNLLPIPVPGSIYGLILMLAALLSGILKVEHVKDVGKLLIQTMPIMFVPAGVGLITAWDRLGPILLPVTVITISSTIIVMVVSGRFTERFLIMRKDNQ